MISNKAELVKVMKERFKDKSSDTFPNLKIPEKIGIEMRDNGCLIILDMQSMLNVNMQEDVNAFEGWAFAVYHVLKKNGDENIQIELDINDYSDLPSLPTSPNPNDMNAAFIGKGHFGRFLYRALRFREQYKWFVLSNKLGDYVEKFESYLSNPQNIFINNVPNGKAGIKQENDLENKVEAKLAEDGKLASILGGITGMNDVFRQLPVGLFKDNPKDKSKAVFTGGKSAIDLWTWNGEVFQVVELKANQKKVGIITEIFFYANYMRDLLLEDGWFTINPNYSEDKEINRGYYNIKAGKYRKINGIMLADIYHPIVCDDVLKLMNENGDCDIEYFRSEYEWEDINVIRK